MNSLSTALTSGDLMVLLATAAALGFLHTVLGPDHYLPFVMMAHAQAWSRRKTALVSFLCGLGHVLGSVVIGVLLAWGGLAAADWAGSRWAFWHEARGSLSAWLLIGVGAAFTVWGLIRARRGVTHTHPHFHHDSHEHAHEHTHHHEHMHVHAGTESRMTPWILFTIFVFGPCESLIPLMLSAWSVGGVPAVTLVSVAFGLVTVATIVGTVALLQAGVERIPLGKLNRWSTSLAGASLVACGAAIQWLGL